MKKWQIDDIAICFNGKLMIQQVDEKANVIACDKT